MQKTQKEKLSHAERQLRPIRIPMPLRYLINALLIAGLWGLMTFLIAQGVITSPFRCTWRPATSANCRSATRALWRSARIRAVS